MTDINLIGRLEPVARASIADQVFDTLHGQVLSLALPPGTKLSEADVAKQLGVSRQPVRDAFYRLSKLGFLLIQPQKATQVSHIHVQDIRKARFIRTAIEVDVMRLAAAKFTAADFEKIDEIITQQRMSLEADDRPTFHRLDDAFHQLICSLAGVGFVWDVIRESKAHTDRVRYMSLASGSHAAYNDHLSIVAALRAGSAKASEAAMRQHLGRIEDIIDTLSSENHQWFSEEE